MRALVFSASLLGVCSIARAETFVIDYTGRAQVDPAETFEADCLGASEAPDCATRAALLEAELVEALAELEGLSDDATKALFSNAVGSSSSAVKEVGLRYFSHRHDLPSTLWASVKEFFFGPDPQIGQPSAEILGFSTDTTDQALSELYLDLRPSSLYDNNTPENSGEQDEWAQACASDQRLDEVPGFAESEQFAPASRLLMVDRYLVDYASGKATIPATGFVTDAPRADVLAYFDKLFGKASSSAGTAYEARVQALNAELSALQPRLLKGDQEAIKRATAIADELTQLSQGVTQASSLQLEEDACADCVYWMAGVTSDYTKPFVRAVVVGTQPQLNRTMISYIGSGGTVPTVDGGTPSSDAGTTRDAGSISSGGDDAGVGEPKPTKKTDGGCSTSSGGPGAWLLAVAVLLVRRRQFGQFM